jgi:hypothetical protein
MATGHWVESDEHGYGDDGCERHNYPYVNGKIGFTMQEIAAHRRTPWRRAASSMRSCRRKRDLPPAIWTCGSGAATLVQAAGIEAQ